MSPVLDDKMQNLTFTMPFTKSTGMQIEGTGCMYIKTRFYIITEYNFGEVSSSAVR